MEILFSIIYFIGFILVALILTNTWKDPFLEKKRMQLKREDIPSIILILILSLLSWVTIIIFAVYTLIMLAIENKPNKARSVSSTDGV